MGADDHLFDIPIESEVFGGCQVAPFLEVRGNLRTDELLHSADGPGLNGFGLLGLLLFDCRVQLGDGGQSFFIEGGHHKQVLLDLLVVPQRVEAGL